MALRLDEDELAERWGVTLTQLQVWRARKYGPAFTKKDGVVIYKVVDVKRFEGTHAAVLKRAAARHQRQAEAVVGNGNTFLRQDALALRWQISPRTLEQWRYYGKGPSFRRIGRTVIYRMKEIEAFEASGEVAL